MVAAHGSQGRPPDSVRFGSPHLGERAIRKFRPGYLPGADVDRVGCNAGRIVGQITYRHYLRGRDLARMPAFSVHIVKLGISSGASPASVKFTASICVVMVVDVLDKTISVLLDAEMVSLFRYRLVVLSLGGKSAQTSGASITLIGRTRRSGAGRHLLPAANRNLQSQRQTAVDAPCASSALA